MARKGAAKAKARRGVKLAPAPMATRDDTMVFLATTCAQLSIDLLLLKRALNARIDALEARERLRDKSGDAIVSNMQEAVGASGIAALALKHKRGGILWRWFR